MRWQRFAWITILGAALATAGAQTPSRPLAPLSPAIGTGLPSPQAVGDTRRQLYAFLRMSPTLTEAVEADPTLLGDTAYVGRVDPELEVFLQQRPEVTRTPDFYLFGDLGPGEPGAELDRRLWPGRFQSNNDRAFDPHDVVPFLVFLVVAAVLIWLVRTALENRRWSRIMKVHTDAHNRLLEKFGNSQELIAYMSSDAGKKFLESAPLAAGLEPGMGPGGVVRRALFSLQAGLISFLAGAGLLSLRNSVADAHAPLLVLGTLCAAVGIGFILSGAASFVIIRKLEAAGPGGGN